MSSSDVSMSKYRSLYSPGKSQKFGSCSSPCCRITFRDEYTLFLYSTVEIINRSVSPERDLRHFNSRSSFRRGAFVRHDQRAPCHVFDHTVQNSYTVCVALPSPESMKIIDIGNFIPSSRRVNENSMPCIHSSSLAHAPASGFKISPSMRP